MFVWFSDDCLLFRARKTINALKLHLSCQQCTFGTELKSSNMTQPMPHTNQNKQ